MATNIPLRVVEEDFEIEQSEPNSVNVTTVNLENKNTRKELVKFCLSISYFVALVYFLVKLLV
jgi:hypothetical protein